MKDYSKKDDWKVIKNVKVELIKRWIDVDKIRINCTKGYVEIEGALEFTGQARASLDTLASIQNFLKKLDVVLSVLPNIRGVKYSLLGWERKGKFWVYQPTPEIRKIYDKKGIK